ncbi:MAG: SpoVR family protein [Phycisphaerales bacterium]|nr:SpoVR family protein [Phycisphaerales bacterium]MCA9531479.1 SpoVR family protein [Myxococcales bacterium]
MSGFAMRSSLPAYLRDTQLEVERHARDFGLDFFPTSFEILPYDRMNEVASYGGFPTRYPHWRFGMDFEQISKQHEYGLSKIYEMVVNSNPSVAYLLEGNSLVDQKLVMAHVYGHVDFFKNNFAFRATDQGRDPRTGEPIRKWIDAMANHGAVVRKWTNRIGVEKVESFVDACLSLENLIDPQRPFRPPPVKVGGLDADRDEDATEREQAEVPLLRVEHEYMESFINPEEFVAAQRERMERDRARKKRVPEEPERDVLAFLIDHAPLERWEQEVLAVIRREAYYFLPQMQTKIMNEGWATYWHSRLMTERLCDASEIVDYADRCAGVLATAPGRLNPYKLGVELYRHIEERWDRGQFGKEWDECEDYAARHAWDRRTGLGRAKIFEVRALYNDVSFIDEFLTPDFVADQKLYAFGWNQRNDRWEIETRQFEEVKRKLLFSLTNAGNPVITVTDANQHNRGELLLKHAHEGIDLRLDWAQEVLVALERIWRRPVEVHTTLEDRPQALRYGDGEYTQRVL